MEAIFTKDEVCKKFQISMAKLAVLMRDGTLPYRKIGRQVRITETDLNSMLRNTLVAKRNGSRSHARKARR